LPAVSPFTSKMHNGKHGVFSIHDTVNEYLVLLSSHSH